MPILILIIFLLLIWYPKHRKRIEEQKRLEKLIRLQNYLTDVNHSNLIMSEKELLRSMKQFVNRHAKIMNDCQDILNKTASPKTFFNRIDVLMESKKALDGLEKVWPGSVHINFATEEQFSVLRNEMIERYWKDCAEKAINASTKRGKESKVRSFFGTLALYDSRMDDKNRRYISSFHQKETDIMAE